VILRRRPQPVDEFEIEIKAGEEIRIPQIAAAMRVRRIETAAEPAAAQPRNQLFQLPAGAEPTFTVRNRRGGDRVKPQKKLKDLLIDRKIAAESRDRIPLLLWNGQIVLVAGVGVTEAFRVTDPPADLYEVCVEEDQEGVQQEGDRPADRRPRR
jgi:tRNA(Ile)-lysidine synthetase-like protein